MHDELMGIGYFGGLKQVADYTKSRYHAPGDNAEAITDYSGMVEDTRLLFDLGYRLSRQTTFPKWKDGSEFKAVREKLR